MKKINYCHVETIILSFADIQHIQNEIEKNDEKRRLFVIDFGSAKDLDMDQFATFLDVQTIRLNRIGVPVIKNPRDVFHTKYSAVFAIEYEHVNQVAIGAYIKAGIGYIFYSPLVKLLLPIKGNDWFDFMDIIRYPKILVDLRGIERNDQMYNEPLFSEFKRLVNSDVIPVEFSTGIIIASREHGNINVFFKEEPIPLPIG